MRTGILSLLLVGFLGHSPAAMACAWKPPINIGDAAFADMVFEGRLTEYTRFSSAEQPDFVTHATATFSVVSVLKGETLQEVTVVLLDQLVGIPEQLILPDTVFVATSPGNAEGNPAPDFPVLLHPTCGTAFILPATADNRAAIMAAIEGL